MCDDERQERLPYVGTTMEKHVDKFREDAARLFNKSFGMFEPMVHEMFHQAKTGEDWQIATQSYYDFFYHHIDVTGDKRSKLIKTVIINRPTET